MFGLIGTLLGYLGYQVGQRADAPSASGSVHSKLGDIKGYMTDTQNTNLNNILAAVNRAPYAAGKTVTLTYGYTAASVSAVGLTDIMTITGPRVILGGYVEIVCDSDIDLTYTFILDDYTLLDNKGQDIMQNDDVGYWDGASNIDKNTYAYRNPLAFSAYYDTSTFYAVAGGVNRWMIVFPPLTPINSILRLAYNSYGAATLGAGWGIWHTAP